MHGSLFYINDGVRLDLITKNSFNVLGNFDKRGNIKFQLAQLVRSAEYLLGRATSDDAAFG